MMPRIAISGANGRLAKAMLPLLESDGSCWLAVSRQPGDGRIDYDQLGSLPRHGLDTFVHLAWSTTPARAESDPSTSWTDDFPLIRRILDSEVIGEGGQFIFFSSGGTVYGDTSGGTVTEQSPLRPVGLYGDSKVFAEKLVVHACMARGIRPVIVRLTNPYGMSIHAGAPLGFIGFALEAALHDRTLELWGDGTITKDFIHVSDVASALKAIIANRLSGCFNLSCGRSHPLNDVIRWTEDVSGRPLRLKSCPAKPWDAGTGEMSNLALREATGWMPSVSLPEGLAMEWRALLAHSRR